MKKAVLKSFVAIAISGLLLAGCAKAPQAEIDAANAAVEEAGAAGADLYVYDSYVALKDSLSAAMEKIEAQKSKLFKNYSGVAEHLTGVTQFAQEVKLKAETRKEEIKAEIQVGLTEVKALQETNNKLVTEAPKGKEGAAAIEAIKGELAAIDSSVAQAAVMFESSELVPALDKVKAAKEKSTAINAELNDVIAKTKGKKK
ncbi:MAG: hypothetical protein HC896_07005 [Bacteroidales bacterium]|nr:hypothetical protein [Bacteroidales bacterium]